MSETKTIYDKNGRAFQVPAADNGTPIEDFFSGELPDDLNGARVYEVQTHEPGCYVPGLTSDEAGQRLQSALLGGPKTTKILVRKDDQL